MSFLLVGVLVWFSVARSPKSSGKIKVSASPYSSVVADADKDTDGDGLKDWEEVLVGTDPKNPDSNNNGVKDGDEKPFIATYAGDYNNLGDTLPTKTLVENFATLYTSSLNAGTSSTIILDDDAVQALTAGSVADAKKIRGKRNPFTEHDVIASGALNVKDYFNNVARITQKRFPEERGDPNYENEITILYTFGLQVQDPNTKPEDLKAALAKLAFYRQRYLETISDLKKISTPKETGTLHIHFLNSLANTALALEEIMIFANDPVVGMMGMKDYADEIVSSKKIFLDAKKIVEKSNIVFEKTDPGYQFRATYLDPAKL